MAKVGRPKLDRELVNVRVCVQVTESEREAVARAADAETRSASQWVRRLIRRELGL